MKVKGKYVAGRDIKIKTGTKKVKLKLPFWVGFGLMLLVLAISMFIPCPTPTQFAVIHIVLAIAGASFISSLSGFFQLHYERIEIGSGLLVFLLLFVYSPVESFIHKPCKEETLVEGYIYQRDQPIKGVVLHIVELDWWGVTRSDGSFTLPASLSSLEVPWNLDVSYRGRDTLIEVKAIPRSRFLAIQIAEKNLKAKVLSAK